LKLINDNEVNVDIVIVGGGPAGYVSDIRASQLGATVALIEEMEIEGICLNRGCIPTKALLKTSDTVYSLNKYKVLGINIDTSSVNWEIAVNRKNRIVKSLRIGLESLMVKNKISYMKGRGIIKASNMVMVNKEKIEKYIP
jgi:dihydrolipoamide dehydrogenase